MEIDIIDVMIQGFGVFTITMLLGLFVHYAMDFIRNI